MARLGEGQAALELREVSVVVTNLIEALAAIRDFRGELNAPVANSVKLRGIARAALSHIGSTISQRAAVAELIEAADAYVCLGRDIDNNTGRAASERLYFALANVRSAS